MFQFRGNISGNLPQCTVIPWCYSAFQEGMNNCVVWVHFHTHNPEHVDSIPNSLSAGEEALMAGNPNTSQSTNLDCTPIQFLCSVASAAFGRAWYYSEEFLERPELSAMKLFRLEQYHLWLPSCPQTCWRHAALSLPSAHPDSCQYEATHSSHLPTLSCFIYFSQRELNYPR